MAIAAVPSSTGEGVSLGGSASRRTVFLVTFDFPPISGPAIWRGLGFAKYLARAGHTVHVFCSDRPSWHRRFDPSLLAELPPEGVIVHRLPSIFLSDLADAGDRIRRRWPRLLKRMTGVAQWYALRAVPSPELHWVGKVTRALLAQSRRDPPDCVLTTGPPHMCHLAGRVLQRIRGVPWIADFRDLWRDDPAQHRPGAWHEWLVERLEALVLRRADAVMTVSPSWQRLLTDKIRRVNGRVPVRLIRNGHDLHARPDLSAPARGAGRPLHIHFAGTIQGGNRTSTLVDALGRMRQAFGHAGRLPVLSYCGLERSLAARAAAHGIEANLRDVGTLSWGASIAASLAADVLLVTVNSEGAGKEGTIPGKVYEAMALGRHVLALVPPDSDVADLLATYGDATVCEVDDVDGVARAVSGLVARHERGELAPSPAAPLPDPRAAAYSRAAQAGELAALIEELAARRRGGGK